MHCLVDLELVYVYKLFRGYVAVLYVSYASTKFSIYAYACIYPDAGSWGPKCMIDSNDGNPGDLISIQNQIPALAS